ncbi:hypothetical protein NFI96_005884 [Prochilodus magdalenae]|nr:hypothetical protein NFI96_005884 [Prochilodus magdalenae]
MEPLRVWILVGLLAAVNGGQNVSSPAQNSSYLILVSEVVRPGIPTTVSVTNLRTSPVFVVSELSHGNSSVRTQSTVNGGSTARQVLPAILEDELSYWFPYELRVRGYIKGTLVFSNSTALRYNPKSMSILLQTDKPNYKPGQTVRIRAVVLTPEGKPYNKQIEIIIMDPRQNKVHQWLSVDTVLGTASKEFQLSENPPLGTWEIVASVNQKRSDDYMYPLYRGPETGDYITITAQVTELLTGVTHNSTVTVSIVMCRYNLEFQEYPSSIKPSLTFPFQIKLSTYSKQPLTSEEQNVPVSITIRQQSFSPMTWNDQVTLLPRNSSLPELDLFLSSIFPYPFENVPEEKIQLNVDADGVVHVLTRLTDSVATLTIEIGQPFTVTMEQNCSCTQFHYVVIAQGQVVDAGTLSSLVFSLSPDVSWFPLAKVLVYCILPDGEIVNDALDVSVMQVLKNNVSLSFGAQSAEPAEETSLTISVSEPKSLVGILVVDKGTMDSDRTNDITEKKASGMTVLTDAELSPVYNYLSVFGPELPGEGVQILALGEEGQQQQQRKNFPETWLWMDINMSELTTSVSLTVPDSMTSWVATAFVISENLGLGISAPVELEVSKDFFLSLNLPAYIIRGELLLLEVSLFNYMYHDLEVMVKVHDSSMFEFVSPSGEDPMAGLTRVSVWSQNATTVVFPIRVTELGQVPIAVSAASIYASDSVSQTILVKPEGIEQTFTQTLFLEFPPNKNILSRELHFNFPMNVVPGSQRAIVTAVARVTYSGGPKSEFQWVGLRVTVE